MANRLFNPDIQYLTASGQAYSGGQLFFYVSGTSTPQNTYSNEALTIANSNPVVLDSNGRAGAIFLINAAYKVVLEDVNGNQIWTQDPVYTSDFSTVAQFQGVNGNPNGQLAGTQGSATIPASVAWDYVDDILYVCTTTGPALTAVWTAVNASAATQIAPAPGGRLTLTSQTPVLSSDVTGATAVLYTPYNSNTVPIYNGTVTLPITFSELTLTLVSAHAANTLYDVFVFSNSGTPTLVTGPAWSNSTAGSCTRGTGASTTQLSMLNGHLVNTVQITGRNSTNTFTIGANLATYVGTIYIDATAGQVSCHVNSFGQNRKYGVWNAFNRIPVILQAGDSTATWTYNTATIRASNNAPSSYSGTSYNVGSGTACNGINIMMGLAEETLSASFLQNVDQNTAVQGQTIGIGYNSITAFSGFNGRQASPNSSTATQTLSAAQAFAPALGLNILACLEEGAGASDIFLGSASNMLLQANYRA